MMNQSHEEIAQILAQRVEESGLEIIQQGSPPSLPDGWGFHITQNGQVHVCEQNRFVELPLILVMDVRIEEPPFTGMDPTIYWQAEKRFKSYWLVGAYLIHDWVPYPREPYRAV